MVRKAMVLGICMIALLSAGNLRAEKPTKTLTGSVEKAEVRGGKVVSVFIKDAREGKFLVARSTKLGRKLLEHLGKTVRATGYVKKTRPGSEFPKSIDVLHYEIVPPVAPESDATPEPRDEGQPKSPS